VGFSRQLCHIYFPTRQGEHASRLSVSSTGHARAHEDRADVNLAAEPDHPSRFPNLQPSDAVLDLLESTRTAGMIAHVECGVIITALTKNSEIFLPPLNSTRYLNCSNREITTRSKTKVGEWDCEGPENATLIARALREMS
jgi:hypothetical protein